MAQQNQQPLERLSLFGAILMNINLMVGAAAFIGPRTMTEYAGSASLYGWLYATLLFSPVVYAIIRIVALFPGKGSFYSYSYHGISRHAGFMSGWLYALGYISIGALQLVALNDMFINQFGMTFIAQSPVFVNGMFLGLLALLSFAPLSLIEKVQTNATLFKLTPLLIAICALIFYWQGISLPAIGDLSLSSTQTLIPVAIFGFWGFEGICSMSHLIDDSAKNAPRAITWGFISTAAIYFLFHLSLLTIMGADNLKLFGAQSFGTYLGLSSGLESALAALITSAIMVAFINAIFGGALANGAMITAMAEEKLFFNSSFFASRSGTGRPFGATLAHFGGILFCIAFLNSKATLNAMANIGILISFMLTIISLVRIRLRECDYKTFVIGMLGLGSCLLLAFYSWQMIGSTEIARLSATAPMLLLMILGYVMFTIAQNKNVQG